MITAHSSVRWALVIGALFPATVAAQSRPPLAPAVARYVSVDAPVVALTHVRIVDGTGAASTDDHKTIVIRGDRIETIGPVGSTPVPDGAAVLDLNGHTVIPGIVGLHEHTWFGGLRRGAPMSVSAPLLYLAMGVTTAMTAGTQFPYQELNLARSVAAGTVPGPRFEIAGPYLTGGAPRPASPTLVVTTPEEARRVVEYWASEGATWIKFLGEGSREVLAAGIREAHARGIKVTGHLCSVTFTEAANLGIDLLQHGFITNSDYVPAKKPDVCPPENMRVQADVDVSSAEVQASIRAIVARGTAVSSTLGVYETFMPTRARLNPEAIEMLDSATRKEVEANHAALANSPFTVPDRLLAKMMEWERAFVRAGGVLGAGCDPWGTGYLPGFGDLRNYELLIEAGFTAEMAVRIMTSNGARILGKEQQVGTIAVGKMADLVVIRGDPVRAPADIYKVVTVFKGGVGFDSMKLRAAARGRVGTS
jgi:imidazolonepropionase-like amidohydrolase